VSLSPTSYISVSGCLTVASHDFITGLALRRTHIRWRVSLNFYVSPSPSSDMCLSFSPLHETVMRLAAEFVTRLVHDPGRKPPLLKNRTSADRPHGSPPGEGACQIKRTVWRVAVPTAPWGTGDRHAAALCTNMMRVNQRIS
jgi:hypothetical protein